MLNKLLRGRIAALRAARSLVFIDMPRSLRCVRRALHPARGFLQRFHNGKTSADDSSSAAVVWPQGRRYGAGNERVG